MASRTRFAIVGGGMLGMTLAHRLARQGHEVSLFEAAPHLGGLASAWQLGDVVWDRHYHVTLLSDSNLRSLLRELGLESDLRWVTTKTGFYTDGHLYSMSNLMEFLGFPPLGMVDKLRLAATILHASRLRRWQDLEDIPVGDWLTRLSGARTFAKIWLPLLRAKLGENYRETSAAFIWAVIARMYAARRTGLKKEMFGYMPGGYARILERFEQVLRDGGVRIEPSQPVETLQATRHGVDITFRSGLRERFDRVVITTPAPIAAGVCPQLSDEETARLRGIRYQGIVCASLLLAGRSVHTTSPISLTRGCLSPRSSRCRRSSTAGISAATRSSIFPNISPQTILPSPYRTSRSRRALCTRSSGCTQPFRARTC